MVPCAAPPEPLFLGSITKKRCGKHRFGFCRFYIFFSSAFKGRCSGLQVHHLRGEDVRPPSASHHRGSDAQGPDLPGGQEDGREVQNAAEVPQARPDRDREVRFRGPAMHGEVQGPSAARAVHPPR